MLRKYFFLMTWFVPAFLMIPVAEAHVQLDSPAGGEHYFAGEQVAIAWTVLIPHEQDNWDLLFSLDGGVHYDTLAADLPVGVTEYNWTVPGDTSSRVRIKIVQDNFGTDYFDVSDFFTINIAPASTSSWREEEGISDLKIYPVPFQETVYFRFTAQAAGDIRLSIYSAEGREVYNTEERSEAGGEQILTWQPGTIPAGVYTWVLSVEGKLKTGQILCKSP